jgi:glycosyltransferase involved in cell wall biosynthesis
MKTVLVFTDSHDQCGVGKFNAALLQGLLEAGHRAVYVKRREHNPLQRQLMEQGVEFHWLDYSPENEKPRFFDDRETPIRILSEISPDLVFFSKGQPMLLYGVIEAARALSIPYIIREGAVSKRLLPDKEQIEFLEAFRLQYEQADAVICVSQDNLSVLQSVLSIGAEIGWVLPASADKRFFAPLNMETRNRIRQEWGVADDAVVCFTSAKLEPIKGHGVQIYAMHLLKDRPEWERLHFVWAGQGSQYQRIAGALKQVGVANKVKLLGQVRNVDELMDASDIFVLTSVIEGMGRVIPEAMAKGLPVIATSVGGIPEAVGAYARLLSPPTDVPTTARELADAIVDWVNDEEGRKSMGQAAKDQRSKNFFEPMIIGKAIEIIEQSLQGKAPE